MEPLEERWCPASYSITDLGILDGIGTGSVANAINSSGQVAGASGHAFLWTAGATNGVPTNPQMRDLGTIPGFSFSGASALNDAGEVVGYAQDANNSNIRDGFYWNGGTMLDVGTLGGTYTDAHGINNAVANVHPVQVVGQSSLPTGEGHAFIWQNGVMTDLNSLVPAGSGWVLGSATGINDNQQIVGAGLHNGLSRGFLFSNGTVTDLGTIPGATTSFAMAVNGTGQVAGGSVSPFHAFLWTNGSMNALPVLPRTSDAYYKPFGLNNASQVVGHIVEIHASAEIRAILWEGNKAIELTKQIPTSSGWANLTTATGVNKDGKIVGSGVPAGGQVNTGPNHAFLMTPATHAQKLTAATTAATPVAVTLSSADVQPLLTVAIARWADAGFNTTSLNGVQVVITDLPGNELGEVRGHTIFLDANAAGWGWFVDATPWDDSEFTTAGDQGEQNHMDLLTALEHELGHMLGFDHTDDASSAMYESLATGIRKFPVVDLSALASMYW